MIRFCVVIIALLFANFSFAGPIQQGHSHIIKSRKTFTLDDSYSESNVDATSCAASTDYKRCGQSFASGGGILDSVKLYLKKAGTPTGDAVAEIYAHSGTYGTSSVPTGSALATSGTLDVSTLTTSYQLITFTFSGANRITLSGSTNYVVVLYYSGASADPNIVHFGADGSSPSHGGNIDDSYPSWPTAYDTADGAFYVYVYR